MDGWLPLEQLPSNNLLLRTGKDVAEVEAEIKTSGGGDNSTMKKERRELLWRKKASVVTGKQPFSCCFVVMRSLGRLNMW